MISFDERSCVPGACQIGVDAISTWHTEDEMGFDWINNDKSLALNN